jgi:hypothetical protein
MNIRRTVFDARIVRGHTPDGPRDRYPARPSSRYRRSVVSRVCAAAATAVRGYHTRPHHRVHATADRTPTPDSPTTSLTIRSLRSLAYALRARPTDRRAHSTLDTGHPRADTPTVQSSGPDQTRRAPPSVLEADAQTSCGPT